MQATSNLATRAASLAASAAMAAANAASFAAWWLASTRRGRLTASRDFLFLPTTTRRAYHHPDRLNRGDLTGFCSLLQQAGMWTIFRCHPSKSTHVQHHQRLAYRHPLFALPCPDGTRWETCLLKEEFVLRLWSISRNPRHGLRRCRASSRPPHRASRRGRRRQ